MRRAVCEGPVRSLEANSMRVRVGLGKTLSDRWVGRLSRELVREQRVNIPSSFLVKAAERGND